MSYTDVMSGAFNQAFNLMNANLAQGQAAQNQYQQQYAQNQQNLQNQLAQQANLYGPGGFGGQTDYYSALGAAYGRETGGFHPSSSVFDTGTTPYNDYNQQYLQQSANSYQAYNQQLLDAQQAAYDLMGRVSQGNPGEYNQAQLNAYYGYGSPGSPALPAWVAPAYSPPGWEANVPAATPPAPEVSTTPQSSAPPSNPMDDYVQAHISRYGYAPDQSYLQQTFPQYFGGGAQPAPPPPEPQQPVASADPSQSNPMTDYVQAHISRYGYAPDQSYLQQTFPQYFGGGVQPAPIAPPPSETQPQISAQPQNPPNSTSQSQTNPMTQYVQEHIARYGYAPDASYLAEAFPSYYYNANTYNAGPSFPYQEGGTTTVPQNPPGSTSQSQINPMTQYEQEHIARYGYGPSPEQIPQSVTDAYNNFLNANAQMQFADSGYGGAADAINQAITAGEADPNAYEVSRAPYVSTLTDNPVQVYDMAVRLSLESNNSQTRTGIAEAMLNRNASTGQNPLASNYFPTDQDYANKYAAATKSLADNPTLLNQIYGEIGDAIGGSNVSQGATDWASSATAADEAKYATSTWTAPDGEQFFRKDIYNPQTGQTQAGATIAKQNQDWWAAMQKQLVGY